MIRLKEITIINAPIERCYDLLLTSELHRHAIHGGLKVGDS
jgi:hypothetical protein